MSRVIRQEESNRGELSPPTPAGSYARLTFRGPDKKNIEKDVLRYTTLIGSSSGCNIQLVDPAIAKVHCIVALESGRLRVRDLRTQTGIRVNGVVTQVASLSDGDVLQVGSFSFHVQTNLPSDRAKPPEHDVPETIAGGEPASAQLVFRGPNDEPLSKDLLRPTTLIGSSTGCNVQLVSHNVAPVHCVVTLESGHLRVRDLRSPSGTLVNNVSIEVAALTDGDRIQLGTFIFGVETNLPHRSLSESSLVEPGPSTRETDSLERERQTLREERSTLQAAQVQLRAEQAQLREQFATLERDRSKLREEQHAADDRAAEFDKQRADFQTAHERNQSERQSIDADIQSHQSTVEKWQDEQQRAETERTDDEAAFAARESQLREDRNQLDALGQRQTKLAEELAAEREKVHRGQEELERRQEKLASQQEEIAAAQLRHRDEVTAFENEWLQFEEQKDQESAAKSLYRNRTEELERQRAELRDDHEVLNSEREQLESDRVELNEREQARQKQETELEQLEKSLLEKSAHTEQVAEELAQEREELFKQRGDLETEHKQFQEAQELHVAACEKFRKETAEAATKAEEFQRTLEADRDAFNAQQEQHNEQVAEFERIQASAQALARAATERVEEASLALEAERLRLREEQTAFQAQQAKLSQEQERLASQRRLYEEQQTAFEAARAALEADEQRVQKTVAEQDGTEHELQQRREQLDAVERELGTSRSQLEIATSGFRREVTSFEEEWEQFRREQEAATLAHEADKKELASLEQQRGELDAQREQQRLADEQLQAAQEQLNTNRSAVEEERRQLVALQDQAATSITELELTRDRLQKQRDEVSGEQDRLTEQKQEADAAAAELAEGLEALKRDRQELHAEQERPRSHSSAADTGGNGDELHDESSENSAVAAVTTRSLAGGGLGRAQINWLLEGRRYRGFFIGHYRIMELLGTGSTGWLYEAEDTETGRTVALKVLSAQHVDDRGMRTRFELEARSCIGVEHPNVVRTIKMECVEGTQFLVMDVIYGASMQELVELKGPIPWPRACDFIAQAAEGLQPIHDSGVVHRDIKPANVLLTHSGELKIIDFGLALIRGDADELTLKNDFGHDCMGTPDYMPPEQAHDSFTVDGTADIYSLGCTLYFVLTAKLPFPMEPTAAKLKAHRDETAVPLGELVADLPEEVAKIVSKMMAKDRAERYQTATEVARALAPFTKRAPVYFDFDAILEARAVTAKKRMVLLANRTMSQPIIPTIVDRKSEKRAGSSRQAQPELTRG